MAVSYTYQGFQNQIAYELGQRSDLLAVPSGLALSPIQQAIQNSIAKWEREHFYFNELGEAGSPIAFNTVSGQEYYGQSAAARIVTGIHIDKIWVTISSNRYSLNPRTEQYLSDTSLNPSVRGQPIDYAYYAEALRFYPIPDGVYPITIEGTIRLTTLSAPTDTNVWLQDAADLIKAEAKMDLLENVLKQTDLADRQKKMIHGDPMNPEFTGYLYALRSENVQRPAVGKMRAMYF